MPGHTTDTWFVADEQGTFSAYCYELCGSGHSGMDAEVRVVSQSEYEQWIAENSDSTSGSNGNGTATGNGTTTGNATASGNASAALTQPAATGGVGA